MKPNTNFRTAGQFHIGWVRTLCTALSSSGQPLQLCSGSYEKLWAKKKKRKKEKKGRKKQLWTATAAVLGIIRTALDSWAWNCLIDTNASFVDMTWYVPKQFKVTFNERTRNAGPMFWNRKNTQVENFAILSLFLLLHNILSHESISTSLRTTILLRNWHEYWVGLYQREMLKT